jgi:hypothetical protein
METSGRGEIILMGSLVMVQLLVAAYPSVSLGYVPLSRPRWFGRYAVPLTRKLSNVNFLESGLRFALFLASQPAKQAAAQWQFHHVQGCVFALDTQRQA